MFARAAAMPEPKITRETIVSLARAVGRGPSLQLAEAKLDGLRKRHAELGAEHMEHCRTFREGKGSSMTTIQAYAPKLAEMEKQIVVARTEVSGLRLARSGRVADQLSGARKEAATRALAALNELDEAGSVLIACCDEIRRAGDADAPYLNLVPSVSMREHATRILR
jgi:hypothetical protein